MADDPAPQEQPFICLASLMRRVYAGEDLFQLANVAAYDANDPNMLMSWSIIFQLLGNRERGLDLQARALTMRRLYRVTGPAGPAALRLLAIVKPGEMMRNTPVDFLVEGSDIALDALYVSPDLPPPASLPPHDVLLVAIGESDENQALLAQVAELVAGTPQPVLNRPERIARLSREGVSALLRDAPGVDIPVTARIDRQGLRQLREGGLPLAAVLDDATFPIIVRPLASHGGRGLARIGDAAELATYLDANPEEAFHIARFVEYRSPDGLYRKYRIALIDGRPYACHLAISNNWMIHYKDAGMADSTDKRAEEERFMRDFDHDFARRHDAAFRAIGARIGLDYLVIDCGEAPDGRLLVFEADNLGFVHALDPVDLFAYKQPQMRKVFDAFRHMLKHVVAAVARVSP